LLSLQPIDLSEAFVFVNRHHRHHIAPVGGKFAIGVNDGRQVVGVAIVGRPVARRLDDGWTAEVIRLCVVDGHRNACSMLYAASWRAARAMGYRKLITYILASEPGTSLKASGWKEVGSTPGRSWSVKSRPRVDKHPLQERLKFEIGG
jgi:hypothetical protein